LILRRYFAMRRCHITPSSAFRRFYFRFLLDVFFFFSLCRVYAIAMLSLTIYMIIFA